MIDMSENPRIIKVYNFQSGTKEFISESDAYIAPWTGLPANSTEVAPPDNIPSGFVTVWDSGNYTWRLSEDNRNKVVYNITNGLPLIIDLLGPLPEGYTILVPNVKYPMWSGDSWVTDEVKKEKEEVEDNKKLKEDLMDKASQEVDTLLDATDPDIMGDDINPDDVTKLKLWKQYRVLLSRVDINNPNWPNLPSA